MRRRAWPICASSCCASLVCASALPTDALATDPPATGAARTDEAVLGEILVTGSRLPLTPVTVSAPVTVLDRRDLERAGADSIGAILQALPAGTGSALNTNVNEGGDGSVRFELRGLGPQRTLILLNGRRFPSGGIGGDASVDLNSMPLAWIDRVEVLTGGASAIYGADAVAGVVNILTRRELEGMDFGGSWTVAEPGDGEIVRGQAAIGARLADGIWNLGVDYVKQDAVALDARHHSATPLDLVDQDGNVAFSGSVAVPEGMFDVPAGNALGLAPDLYTRTAGSTGQTAQDYRPLAQPDTFNFAPYNYSQTPNERGSLWLLGSFPLGSDTRVFAEGLLHRRESSQRQAPELYFSSFQPGPLLADGTTGVPATNFYNPFGVDISFVTRRFVENGPRAVDQDIDLWRALIGIEGERGNKSWRLTLGRARSDATTRESGLFALARLVDALGPSGPDDSGRIVCGARDPSSGRVPPANVIAGCVPLNLFGGAGSITPEQLAYLAPRPLVNGGTNEQRTAEAIVHGRWSGGPLPELGWAIGAEYRREAGSLVADPLRELGFDGLVNSDVRGGAFNAREAFAELQVPLLRARRWARELGVNFGARWSHFSSFDENVAWQAGLHWQPLDEITLRASYAGVFRAPGLAELYTSPLTGAAFGFDPCGNEPTPAQRVNCAANGVPGGEYMQPVETFAVISGGNPQLEPETGRTLGGGIRYEPAWLRGLAVSIDLFEVELSDFIGTPGVDEVLFECAEHGVGEVCATLRRFADGRLQAVSIVGRNFGRLQTRGMDLAVDWRASTALGDLSSRLLATYLKRWTEQPFPDGERFERAGRFGAAGALPRWRAAGHLEWRSGPWSVSYAAQYIGSHSERVRDGPLFGTLFDPFTRRIDAVLFQDLEFGRQFGGGLTARAVVSNVTDEEPPFIDNAPANTDVATYRLLGRTYVLELRHQFR